MLHELSVQAVSDTALLAKVKRSNYLLGVRAKRCQVGLGPEPAWCRKGTLRKYNVHNDNNNPKEPSRAVKNKKMYVFGQNSQTCILHFLLWLSVSEYAARKYAIVLHT